MQFGFADVDFDRHAVVFHIVEIGLHRGAGIVAVLLQSLLEVEQQIQIVGRPGPEPRQALHDADGVAFGAADFEIAEINRLFAFDDDVQVGGMFVGIDGGLRRADFGQRVFLAGYGGEDGGFAVAPFGIVEIAAHRLAPVFHSVFIVVGQIFVGQDVAENRHADIVDFGTRPRSNADHITAFFGADADFAVEIAFGAQHGFDVVGGFFRQKAYLLAIQLFFLLLGNQRQVFFNHFLDFRMVGFDPDGELGFELDLLFLLLTLRLLLRNTAVLRRIRVEVIRRPSLRAGQGERGRQNRREQFFHRFGNEFHTQSRGRF